MLLATVVDDVITSLFYFGAAHIEHTHLLGDSVGYIGNDLLLRLCGIEALNVIYTSADGDAHFVIGFDTLRKHLYIVQPCKINDACEKVLFLYVCVDVGYKGAVNFYDIGLKAQHSGSVGVSASVIVNGYHTALRLEKMTQACYLVTCKVCLLGKLDNKLWHDISVFFAEPVEIVLRNHTIGY